MRSDNDNQRNDKIKKWCMVIDIEKCENCNNCFLACKDEHYGNEWQGYSASQPLHGQRWMNILKKEHGEFPYIRVSYLPKPCFHCDEPKCMNSTLNKPDAIYKREDGIVIIDPEKSKGDKEILKKCPYGAIWWNEEKKIAQKCTLCAHLLDDGWKAPRCVQACPTGALTFHAIEIDQFDNFVKSNKLEFFISNGNQTIQKENLIKSNGIILYKNLHLYNKCFVAGSVAAKKYIDKKNQQEIFIEECVKDAFVELYKDNTLIAKTTTDPFGDYSFEGLPKNSGKYQIIIKTEHKQYEPIEIELGKSCFAGTTWINMN